MKNRTREQASHVISTVLMVVLALVLGGVLIILSGNSPAEAYGAMVNGAFGSKNKISELFVKLIPIMLMAFGVSIAYKGQLWNIGATGQFVMGAIATTIVALYFPGPVFLKMIVSFIAAIAAGALWAAIAGWLKNRFNANEVITTIMLTHIARYFLMYAVTGPAGFLHDPYSDLTQSDAIPEGMHLSRLLGNSYRLHSGIFILATAIILMFFFWKTTTGHRIDLTGQGRKVAVYAGVNVRRTVMITLLISGGFAGLAGWLEIVAIQYRLQSTFTDYGNIATIIALLGGLSPAGIIASAAFFSVLLCGGSSMQRMTNVPYSVVDVMQGLIIILIIAKTGLSSKVSKILDRFGRKKEKEAQND